MTCSFAIDSEDLEDSQSISYGRGYKERKDSVNDQVLTSRNLFASILMYSFMFFKICVFKDY